MRNSLLTTILLLGLLACASCRSSPDSIEGVWRATAYFLKTGESHSVDGTIFFQDERWLVLFYVLDLEGKPARGSAEGGAYTTDGNRLNLFHVYNLSSGGGALSGLDPASPRTTLRAEGTGELEECTYEVGASQLTIRFPSGNSMEFTRQVDD